MPRHIMRDLYDRLQHRRTPMNTYAMPASEQEMCRCSDHAAHLRDVARNNEKQAPEWERIGRHDYAQKLRDGAEICRSTADYIERCQKGEM